ncbi:MAG: hypothetical protein ACYTXA_33770 [Nostoc sp.]
MIDALIHEWHESALAIVSLELTAAFSAGCRTKPKTLENSK